MMIETLFIRVKITAVEKESNVPNKQIGKKC